MQHIDLWIIHKILTWKETINQLVTKVSYFLVLKPAIEMDISLDSHIGFSKMLAKILAPYPPENTIGNVKHGGGRITLFSNNNL